MRKLTIDEVHKVLTTIYEESGLETQMSQTDIAAHCGVSGPYVNRLFQKLELKGIVRKEGNRRTTRYTWIGKVPNKHMAIEFGGKQVDSNYLQKQPDSDLIEELKKRGYMIFREC